MPTTKPRYTYTDTGRLRELLDSAQGRWPEIRNRKALLIKLAEQGHDTIAAAERRLAGEERRAQTQAALDQVRSLIDPEVLLSDQAWQ